MTIGAEVKVAHSIGVPRRALEADIAERDVAVATGAEDSRLVFSQQSFDEVFEPGPGRREDGGGLVALGFDGIVVVEPTVQREIGGGGARVGESVRRKVLAHRFGERRGRHEKMTVGALAGGCRFLRVAHAGGAATLELSNSDPRGSEAGETAGESGNRQVVRVHDGPV